MCPKCMSDKATSMIMSNLVTINISHHLIQLALHKPGSSETPAFRTENVFSHKIAAPGLVYLRF